MTNFHLERFNTDAKAKDKAALRLMVLACILAIAGWVAFQIWRAHMESESFNKLTGAKTTWVDALFVQLRITRPAKE